MARYKGTFTVSANYEPLIAAPFDARQLVESKADLINPATWQRPGGEVWTFTGMMVSVATDVNPNNNGLYLLIAEDYTQESNWRKCADSRDVERLQQKIENIEVSGGGSLDMEVETETDLPEIGNSNTTYYVKENLGIYRWQEETQSYISFGTSSGDLDINIIYGGNANGTSD